jgi:hypothetical protein
MTASKKLVTPHKCGASSSHDVALTLGFLRPQFATRWETPMPMTRAVLLISLIAGAVAVTSSTHAQLSTPIDIIVQNAQFLPASITVPADSPFVLRVKNLDPNPVEFASAMLRVDRLISPNTSVYIQIGNLQPGRYTFNDVARSATHGVLIVQ